MSHGRLEPVSGNTFRYTTRPRPLHPDTPSESDASKAVDAYRLRIEKSQLKQHPAPMSDTSRSAEDAASDAENRIEPSKAAASGDTSVVPTAMLLTWWQRRIDRLEEKLSAAEAKINRLTDENAQLRDLVAQHEQIALRWELQSASAVASLQREKKDLEAAANAREGVIQALHSEIETLRALRSRELDMEFGRQPLAAIAAAPRNNTSTPRPPSEVPPTTQTTDSRLVVYEPGDSDIIQAVGSPLHTHTAGTGAEQQSRQDQQRTRFLEHIASTVEGDPELAMALGRLFVRRPREVIVHAPERENMFDSNEELELTSAAQPLSSTADAPSTDSLRLKSLFPSTRAVSSNGSSWTPEIPSFSAGVLKATTLPHRAFDSPRPAHDVVQRFSQSLASLPALRSSTSAHQIESPLVVSTEVSPVSSYEEDSSERQQVVGSPRCVGTAANTSGLVGSPEKAGGRALAASATLPSRTGPLPATDDVVTAKSPSPKQPLESPRTMEAQQQQQSSMPQISRTPSSSSPYRNRESVERIERLRQELHSLISLRIRLQT